MNAMNTFRVRKTKVSSQFWSDYGFKGTIKIGHFHIWMSLGFTYNFAYSPFNVTIESKQKQYTDRLQYDSF